MVEPVAIGPSGSRQKPDANVKRSVGAQADRITEFGSSILEVLLILVFGSVVAAALPLVVGLLGVAAGFAAIAVLAHLMPVSAYASNVVSMIGLGVGMAFSGQQH